MPCRSAQLCAVISEGVHSGYSGLKLHILDPQRGLSGQGGWSVRPRRLDTFCHVSLTHDKLITLECTLRISDILRRGPALDDEELECVIQYYRALLERRRSAEPQVGAVEPSPPLPQAEAYEPTQPQSWF